MTTPTNERMSVEQAVEQIEFECIIPGGTYTLPVLDRSTAADIIRRTHPTPPGDRATLMALLRGCRPYIVEIAMQTCQVPESKHRTELLARLDAAIGKEGA